MPKYQIQKKTLIPGASGNTREWRGLYSRSSRSGVFESLESAKRRAGKQAGSSELRIISLKESGQNETVWANNTD